MSQANPPPPAYSPTPSPSTTLQNMAAAATVVCSGPADASRVVSIVIEGGTLLLNKQLIHDKAHQNALEKKEDCDKLIIEFNGQVPPEFLNEWSQLVFKYGVYVSFDNYN